MLTTQPWLETANSSMTDKTSQCRCATVSCSRSTQAVATTAGTGQTQRCTATVHTTNVNVNANICIAHHPKILNGISVRTLCEQENL